MIESVGFRLLDERKRIRATTDVVRLNIQVVSLAKPDAEKDRVVFTFELFERYVASNGDSVADIYAEGADHFRLAHRVLSAHLVGSDAIRIQSSGMGLGIENHRRASKAPQLCRTSQARRTGPYHRYSLSVLFPSLQHVDSAIEHVIHCVSLQPSDLHRLLAFGVQNTRSFA